MKALFFLLFPVFIYSQVNVDDPPYNAVGNGTTDDTTAIQLALDSGQDVSFGAGKTYLISNTLDIDGSGNQTITGNGATITINTNLDSYMLVVNKSSGVVTMTDLLVDANKNAQSGINLRSSFNFTNVDLQDVYEDNLVSGCYGIRIDANVRLFSEATLDGCDVDDVESLGNGVIADAPGAAKAIFVFWDNAPFSNDITVKNATYQNIYGDDSDIIDLYEYPANPSQGHSITFIDCVFQYSARRIVKARQSHATFIRCVMRATQPNDPRLTGTPQAGLFVAGNVLDEATYSEDITLYDCEVYGTSYMYGVTPSKTNNFGVYRTDFFDEADFLAYRKWGNLYVAGCSFSNDSRFTYYGLSNGFTNGAGLGVASNVNEPTISMPGSYPNLNSEAVTRLAAADAAYGNSGAAVPSTGLINARRVN